jgi:hypothetical protein
VPAGSTASCTAWATPSTTVTASSHELGASAPSQLHVGGRVTIGATAQPKYLRGQTGEVHEIDGDMAVVCLDTPVGRFTSGHVRCPVELLVPAGT